MQALVFQRVQVSLSAARKQVVSWELSPDFKLPESGWGFFVETTRAMGEWDRLNEEALTGYAYETPVLADEGMIRDRAFRVVLSVDEDLSSPTEYASNPVLTIGDLPFRLFRIARAVLFGEYQRLDQGAGTAGYLLKRRLWGTECTTCIDSDTKSVQNSSCPYCYGTGYTGGYFAAYPYRIDFSQGRPGKAGTNVPEGHTNIILRQGRSVAFPTLYPGDLWIASTSEERYVLKETQVVAEIGGVELVYQGAWEQIPPASILYTVPLAPSSGVVAQAEAWRQAAKFTY